MMHDLVDFQHASRKPGLDDSEEFVPVLKCSGRGTKPKPKLSELRLPRAFQYRKLGVTQEVKYFVVLAIEDNDKAIVTKPFLHCAYKISEQISKTKIIKKGYAS